jgi:hypothetical protein
MPLCRSHRWLPQSDIASEDTFPPPSSVSDTHYDRLFDNDSDDPDGPPRLLGLVPVVQSPHLIISTPFRGGSHSQMFKRSRASSASALMIAYHTPLSQSLIEFSVKVFGQSKYPVHSHFKYVA